ncbi:putative tuberin, partial [Operophtera brumata]
MFNKKSHQDVKKSSVKIQDSKKDSSTRLKHLKIVLEHFDSDEAKTYFESNFSHVYFILYDNFIQAENNLRQKVHKAGKEELEGALALLEKVLCLLPELIGKRWQLHSLTRIFSKLLHSGNSQKLRAEAISLVPGMPDPSATLKGLNPKSIDITAATHDSGDFSMEELMQHPNFAATTENPNAKKVIVEQTPAGIIGKLATVSASIFHDTNALNPVQSVDIQPLLPPSASEKAVDNETKYFFEILLEGMASSVTKIQWRDRSHAKSMRCFAFMLEKFRIYYLPWVASYAHFMKKAGSDGGPASLTSTGSHLPHSNTPTPAASLHHEEETSFTVGHPSDSSVFEELSAEQVARDVLCCSSREHVDFTIEVLRQAFLLPFAHAAAARRVIALYKDWIQMNVAEIPPFLIENTYEQQLAAGGGEPAPPPRRLRNDSYLGAVSRDNNVLQVFMTQAATVFLASSSPVAPPGALGQQQLLEEQTDTEQLLLVLLQITSLVLTKVPPKRKQDTLGGFLAPALFQTLIVTWIKANLNVAVKPELGVESSSIKDSPLQIDLASDGGNLDKCKPNSKWKHGNTRAGAGRALLVQQPAASGALASLPAGAASRSVQTLHGLNKLLAWRLLCESTQAQGPGAPSSCNNRLHLAHLHLYQRALHHGARVEHSGACVPTRGRGRGAMRGRVRTGRARVSPARYEDCVRTSAVLRHMPAADAYGKIIKWICACLAQISSTSARDPVKPLAGSLLLCLAEFAVRCGPAHLLQEKDGDQTLLLMIFKVIQISSTSARDPVKPLAGSLLLCLAEFAVRCGPAHLLQEKDGDQTLLLMIFKVIQIYSTSARDPVKPLAGSLLLCLAEFAVRCGPAHLLQEKDGDQTLLLMIFKVIQISSTSARDPVKPLAGSLLLCLAEFAVRCGPAHLLQEKDGDQTLLLMIFKVIQISSTSARDPVKPLAGSLLLCLAEYAVRCGPAHLLQEKDGDQTLLLMIFKVIQISSTSARDPVKPLAGSLLLCLAEFATRFYQEYYYKVKLILTFLNFINKCNNNVFINVQGLVLYAVMKGTSGTDIEGLTLPVDEDFDPNIQLDNLAPKTQLVLFLGHWPLWSGCQLSSSVCEQHDSPALGQELGPAVLSAPHIQLMRQVHTSIYHLLRDIAGKACWDAFALYYDPSVGAEEPPQALPFPDSAECPRDSTLSSLPSPLPPDLLPDHKNSPPDKHQLDHEARSDILSNRCGSPAYEAFLAALAWEIYVGKGQEARSDIFSNRCGSPAYEAFLAALAWEIYVGKGQETRSDILSNRCGSPAYEAFLAALAWEIYVGKGQEARSDILSNRCGSPAYEAFLAALAWEIYVGKGQEARSYILSNRCGSPAYEAFLAALAWEIYVGKGQEARSDTLSNRCGSPAYEALLAALAWETRHLGNDEVHVVWSEHWRPYKRDTLPTQFCDVLI